jgi:hypothetical protein
LYPAADQLDHGDVALLWAKPNEIHTPERELAIDMEIELGQEPGFARFGVSNSQRDVVNLRFSEQGIKCHYGSYVC